MTKPKYYLFYGNDGDGGDMEVSKPFDTPIEAKMSRVDSYFYRNVHLIKIKDNMIKYIETWRGGIWYDYGTKTPANGVYNG